MQMIISHVSFESVYSASQTSHSLCLALTEPYVVDWAQSTKLTNLTHSLFEVFHTDFVSQVWFKLLNCFILTFTGRSTCRICCHSIIQLIFGADPFPPIAINTLCTNTNSMTMSNSCYPCEERRLCLTVTQ